jgi:hypothetical protein
MPACMPWRSRPRRRANEVKRDGWESHANSFDGLRPALGTVPVATARRMGELPNIDDSQMLS